MRAMNRLPGRIRLRRGSVAWPLAVQMVSIAPGLMGLGGIVGGAGQSVALLLPAVDSKVATAAVAMATMIILGSGAYRRVERALLVMVIGFTFTTLLSAALMQSTVSRVDLQDLAIGFSFGFPAELALLALAMYGYTGVNAAEISAYTYWCIEKGYPSFIGPRLEDAAWVERARGWIRVLQTDVAATLVILTCATVPFYLLGAGILHPAGARPQGLDTIRLLSAMFTQTFGGWSVWLFGIGAFFILFSSGVSAIAAGARGIPEYAIELGFVRRAEVRRERWIRGYVLVVPTLAFLFYVAIPQPVLLVTIGAVTQALLLPMQSGATLWLQRRHLDPRVWPSRTARGALVLTFLFQLAMAVLLVRYTIL
jgi:hypothetical protein